MRACQIPPCIHQYISIVRGGRGLPSRPLPRPCSIAKAPKLPCQPPYVLTHVHHHINMLAFSSYACCPFHILKELALLTILLHARATGPYILLHVKSCSSSTTYHPSSHPPRSSISMMSTPPHTANISATYVEPLSPSCLVLATICHKDHHTKVYIPSVCHILKIISIHDHRPPCHNLHMLLSIVEGWSLHLKLHASHNILC